MGDEFPDSTGPGTVCTDINECDAADSNKCDTINGQCTNSFGSYECSCMDGYYPNHGGDYTALFKDLIYQDYHEYSGENGGNNCLLNCVSSTCVLVGGPGNVLRIWRLA